MAETQDPGRWIFVAHPDAPIDLSRFEAALAAAPSSVARGGKLLPRAADSTATCRICGVAPATTREHVPPRAAGNTRSHRAPAFTTWLERESLDEDLRGPTHQGGIFGFTLCGECNSRSGRYATEYARWAGAAVDLVRSLPESPAELDAMPMLKELTVQLPRVQPSAFARQVLASFCTIAGSWELTEQYPEVREIVLGDDPAQLAQPLDLSMGFFLGPHAFVAGPTVQVQTSDERWRWVASFAYPPFAFELTLAASDPAPASPLCGIADLLTVPASAHADVELQVPLTFAHTQYPGDWRNRYQVENQLSIYGVPEGQGN